MTPPGAVVGTLDYMVARNAAGEVVGLIDFEAHEAAGGRLTDIWRHSDAAGSGTWPEFIGARAHEFRVELDGSKRITALVHKQSGHRRVRSDIEAAIGATARECLVGHRCEVRQCREGPEARELRARRGHRAACGRLGQRPRGRETAFVTWTV